MPTRNTVNKKSAKHLALDRVYQGDCTEQLKSITDASVDLIFADPPFNIGYDYDIYDDRRAAEDYLEWSRKWIAEVWRVLKPSGTFWLAIGDEYAAELKLLCTNLFASRSPNPGTVSPRRTRNGFEEQLRLRRVDRGFHCRNWVIWYYTFGVHCKYKFTRSHAHLLYFVKNPKEFTFNSLAIRVPSARELVYGDKRADASGRVPDDTWLMAPVLPSGVPTRDGFVLRPQDIPERFPAESDTWFFSRVAGTFAERHGWHGCQMPEQLLGRILRACSNEADVVLDPFGGSGTTLAVAKKLNRRFIGFEISSEYVSQTEKRLANINVGDPLTGPENPARSAPCTKEGRILQRPRVSSNARRKASTAIS